MDLPRFWRHVRMSPIEARRSFSPEVLDDVERAVAACEKRHRGEVVFVVEAELGSGQLWRGVTSRDRAREVFAQQGVWNTEENNGVLVYVLLADRTVEIVADRGVDRCVARAEWDAICRAMEEHFRARRFRDGALAGVQAVAELLAREFPARGEERNELGDRPVVM